jgi:hypothetical protein
MEEFYQKCEEKLKFYSEKHEKSECVVWTGPCSKGYGQFRYRDPRDPFGAGHRTRGAHRMALMVAMHDLDVSSRKQASHLCNNKLCVNVVHLNFEDNYTNNNRKICFDSGHCSGHVDTEGQKQPDCIVDLG